MLFLSVIESELVFVERADRDLDHAPAIREYDRLIRDDRAQVFLNSLADPLAVAFLVYLAFALKRPVISLNRHFDSLLVGAPACPGRTGGRHITPKLQTPCQSLPGYQRDSKVPT